MRRLSACVHTSVLLALTLAAPSFGCMERELAPIDPKTSRFLEMEVGGDAITAVDLLFVIDSSGSMEQEQESLRREIPQLVRDLTDPPRNEAGLRRWNAVESIRIAVVDTNLGTNGFPAPGSRVGAACTANANLGTDGVLSLPSTCGGGAIVEWETGDDIEDFVDSVACRANVGLVGCGLEQQLGAGVKGLVSASALGNFPREDAVLAIVVVTDEEDCSLADPEGFFSGAEVGRALNQRCVLRQEFLLTLEALKTNLLGGRDEQDVIFSAIVGMPEDLVGQEPGAILADSRMQYMLDNTNELGLQPACERDGNGQAAPGRRFVELARLWPGSLVSSICAESFRPAIEALAARIGSRIRGICSNRSLTPDADGAVECNVRETLPVGMRCDGLVGRTYVQSDDEGRDVCVVQQAVRGVASGWFYDVSSPECEQVAFTSDAFPPLGATVSLVCLVEVERPLDPTGP